jgi:hypothetical protein
LHCSRTREGIASYFSAAANSARTWVASPGMRHLPFGTRNVPQQRANSLCDPSDIATNWHSIAAAAYACSQDHRSW